MNKNNEIPAALTYKGFWKLGDSLPDLDNHTEGDYYTITDSYFDLVFTGSCWKLRTYNNLLNLTENPQPITLPKNIDAFNVTFAPDTHSLSNDKQPIFDKLNFSDEQFALILKNQAETIENAISKKLNTDVINKAISAGITKALRSFYSADKLNQQVTDSIEKGTKEALINYYDSTVKPEVLKAIASGINGKINV